MLLQTPAARAVERHIFTAGESLHAPHLIDLEVTQVLRRYARSGTISDDRGAAALDVLVDFPLTRYPHRPLLDRVWQFRHVLTSYDAAYLALAEALDATLVTRDRALTNAGSPARVEVV